MVDIRDRADIDVLLRSFYERVFSDALLARIFVDIAHMDLEKHLPDLGDFWEKVLFNTVEYNGRAMDVHRRIHRREPLTAAHFARWLELWDETLTREYDGQVAEQAKAHAARIAVAIQRALQVESDHTRRELPIRQARRGPV